MGSYTFRWDHPASEVFVTGTFDNWAKTEQLQQDGQGLAKKVRIPDSGEKILYKFVVDGQWTTDHTAASETDSTGNLNNVLHPHDIISRPETPGDVIPGGFPITPAAHGDASLDKEDGILGVNPLPATTGAGNPISLKPGDKVPNPSSFTSNTVDSNVRLDKDSYEKSDAGASAAPPSTTQSNDAHLFTLPPISGNMIPESSLPMGAQATGSLGLDNTPFMSSTGPGSTTSQLAGQVPVEPRGVPVVVADSQQAAHASPEASASSQAVQQKARVEDELKHTVQATSSMSGTNTMNGLPASIRQSIEKINGDKSNTTTASAVPAVVADSMNKAHTSPEAAASAEAVREKSEMEQELRNQVTPALASVNLGSTTTDPSPASNVPAVVSESLHQAHAAPEAASSAEAVREKSAMEAELQSKTAAAPGSDDSASTQPPTLENFGPTSPIVGVLKAPGTPKAENRASTPTKRVRVQSLAQDIDDGSMRRKGDPIPPKDLGKKLSIFGRLKQKLKKIDQGPGQGT